MTVDNNLYKVIRDEFDLDRNYIHLSNGTIASHPHVVQNAIEKHRKALDHNPALYIQNREIFTQAVLTAAAAYLETSSELIVLTESTTMGLSLIYHGLRLTKQDEVLTTTHDHYATQETLRFKCKSSGAYLRRISLYEDPQEANTENILKKLLSNINPKTRVIALTWVHSCSGVKLPIAKIGQRIREINQARDDENKILLCVDGLHAFGIENFEVEALQCDFFVAGCHKSLYGPRGTGLVWGNEWAWRQLTPLIPSFDNDVFYPWLKNQLPEKSARPARFCNPGGFMAFEHRWALREAFDFHLQIGKRTISEHIHQLNMECKLAMQKIPHIKLLTPLDKEFSSGIICFERQGFSAEKMVAYLLNEKIIIGQTPYPVSTARLMPGLYNTPEDIEKTLSVLKSIVQKEKYAHVL